MAIAAIQAAKNAINAAKKVPTPVAAAPAPAAPAQAPAPAAAPVPDYVQFAEFLKGERQKAMDDGKTLADQHFGAGNPEMQAIIEERRKRALGLNADEINLMRSQAGSEINRQMQTGLRQLRGIQALSGVRGGAAIGQSVPLLRAAADARAKAETDISLADMQRRSAELGALESTLTGERAGKLGTVFGMAGLDATDRSSGMQYLLGKDFLKHAQEALTAAKAADPSAPLPREYIVEGLRKPADAANQTKGQIKKPMAQEIWKGLGSVWDNSAGKIGKGLGVKL